MADCPFNPSDFPCEMEMDLIILQEAERESMEIFYAMREELRFYLKRTQMLESILTAKRGCLHAHRKSTERTLRDPR